jgi:hypothetical protein
MLRIRISIKFKVRFQTSCKKICAKSLETYYHGQVFKRGKITFEENFLFLVIICYYIKFLITFS